jgi:hypothetical protein
MSLAVGLLGGAALIAAPATAQVLGGGAAGGLGGTVGGIGGSVGGAANGGMSGIPTTRAATGIKDQVHATPPSAAPATGAASAATRRAEGAANNATDSVEKRAEAAQHNATSTLNNTASAEAGGSANANVGRQSAGASAGVSTPRAAGAASRATQHAMGVGNSGLNNTEAATNDAQAQAAQDLNRQPSASASVDGAAGGTVK